MPVPFCMHGREKQGMKVERSELEKNVEYAQIKDDFLYKNHIVYNFSFCYYKSRNFENAFKK